MNMVSIVYVLQIAVLAKYASSTPFSNRCMLSCMKRCETAEQREKAVLEKKVECIYNDRKFCGKVCDTIIPLGNDIMNSYSCMRQCDSVYTVCSQSARSLVKSLECSTSRKTCLNSCTEARR